MAKQRQAKQNTSTIKRYSSRNTRSNVESSKQRERDNNLSCMLHPVANGREAGGEKSIPDFPVSLHMLVERCPEHWHQFVFLPQSPRDYNFR